jgi:DNA-binding MarR family transcriptional regulator/GNAT superfamily N-acetyltransferase
MEFFNKTGKIAIGSRLRMLTDKITNDAAEIYKLYDVDIQPKWFPVYYAISGGEAKTITGIAQEIGHSHASVSKIVHEMSKKGLITEKRDRLDGRRNVVSLSKAGKSINQKIQYQYKDVGSAIDELSASATHDLWQAIQEWEFLLEQKSLFNRVREKQKQRESGKVQIVNYQSKYAKAFRSLNEEWISTYFRMEQSDYDALDDPKGYILKNGGVILVALYNNEPVGVCALIRIKDGKYDYELAKMAVSPKLQGKNIGWLLGTAALSKAKELGATSVYLESNTVLKPAINLYHKLGFQKVAGHPTPYERCNIQMAIHFNNG